MSGLPASLRFGTAPPKASPSSRQHPTSSQAAGSPGGGGASSATAAAKGAAAAWEAECERVADRLVITVPADQGADSSSWRPQLERALASLSSLQAAAPGARAEVEGSRQELAAGLEELAVGEHAASTQLAGLRAEHQAAVAAVAALQQEQASRQEYVASLEQELLFLQRELEERQREVAEQGDSMSDTRPVARLAQACTDLRAELVQMDVRTGILQHLLLQTMARG